MTNNNPNLISNELLKQKINRHYDFFYTALTEGENNQADYNFYARLLPYYKKHFFIDGNTVEFEQSAQGNKQYLDYTYDRRSLRPIDMDKMRKDRAFAVELSEIIFFRTALLSLYDDIFDRIESLNRDIDLELSKN